MGIIVRTVADKVVNHGGGWKTSTKFKPNKFLMKVFDKDGKEEYKEETVWEKTQVAEKKSGTDYIVFRCAACGMRNRRNAYDAKVFEDGKVLSYKCNKCYITNEVVRPLDLGLSGELIEQTPTGLLGPDGKEIKK